MSGFKLKTLLGAWALALTAGCSHVSSPWDSTGYFKQDRTRTAEQDAVLRQRAQLQRDRTYG
jgi:hypothetical protein